MGIGNGSRFGGWIAFIAFIIIFNVLSRVFDWGWVFY